MMRCCVPNCKSDNRTIKKAQGITFHQLPNDPALRNSWLDSLNLSDWLNNDKGYVCSKHFNLDDLYRTRSGVMNIRSGAVPLVDQDSGDLDSPVTEKICRICLGMNRKMYNIKDNRMDIAFEQVTGVPVTGEEKLPQKLCFECSHRLLSCVRFKDRSMKSQALLMEVLDHNHYISLRDVRSLGPSLSSVRSPLSYGRCDNDINVIHDDMAVKDDCKLESDGEDNVMFDDCDNLDREQSDAEVKVENEQTQTQVEVKNENENEIYLNEYTDNFDSEDDRKLSEVYKSEEKKEIKQKKKVKKKEGKRKERVAKKRERVEDENNPATTMDKYKTSNVKRRKNDGLDESLFTITTLTYEEQIAEISRRAESSMYISAPYKCTACYRGFLNVDRYYSHRVRHTEAAGAYECFICKTRLKSARALRKHLTAQHTEKFSCKGCTFTTRNRGVAREHEKWHAGTKYHCPHCPSEFDKVTTYMGHIRIKHVSDCVCELCGYTFISQKGIEVHKKKKHRIVDKNIELEGPYCEICDVKFLSEEAHARHLKLSSRHSSDSDPNRIRNDSQSKGSLGSSGSRRSLEKRLVIHAADGGEQTSPVTCEQCGVELRDLRLYAQHFRRAHPDKNRTKYPAMKTPCMCELCGRIFQSMALLKDHMWVHTGEKRFKCDRCDKSFTQKTNLVFHMRVHSASRPTYECPLCGKHFAFYNNRRRHMFIHTGLKPFKCDTCGKCFTTQGEQRAHLEHVHLKKPWPKRSRQRQKDDAWPRQGQDD